LACRKGQVMSRHVIVSGFATSVPLAPPNARGTAGWEVIFGAGWAIHDSGGTA
jgi:hypothetical protein